MTQYLSPAQQAQQTNRTADGRYTVKTHAEADINLDTPGPYPPALQNDIDQQTERSVTALREHTGDGGWSMDFAPETGQGRICHDDIAGDVFSITPSDRTVQYPLAKPSMIVTDLDPKISEHNPAKTREVYADNVPATVVNSYRQRAEAYAFEHKPGMRSDALDDLARQEGVHVLSRIDADEIVGADTGEIAKSHHLDGYDSLMELPDAIIDNADSIYTKTQEYHYGAGAEDADELRSSFIVTRENDDDNWQIIHAYAVDSETESESRHKVVDTASTLSNARSAASDYSKNLADNGSIAETFLSEPGLGGMDKTFWDDDFWGRFDHGYHAVDDGTVDDPIQLRHQEDVEPGV